MIDRVYIVSRTLEDKIAIAENIDQNVLFVTIDVLKEILALLKEQDNMISIKVVSDFLAEYALPPTLQKQNLFSFNGNMASEWEQFLRDLKGR